MARLQDLLLRASAIADRTDLTSLPDAAFDKAARISAAYEAAPPVVQRRFDALAAETAAWGACGLGALVADRTARPAGKAATRLAYELDRGLRDLGALVGA